MGQNPSWWYVRLNYTRNNWAVDSSFFRSSSQSEGTQSLMTEQDVRKVPTSHV